MMATKADKYVRFDAGDYLDGIEDGAAYLQIALAESADDPTAVHRALGVIARSQNMSGLNFPEENFVFTEDFKNLLTTYQIARPAGAH